MSRICPAPHDAKVKARLDPREVQLRQDDEEDEDEEDEKRDRDDSEDWDEEDEEDEEEGGYSV